MDLYIIFSVCQANRVEAFERRLNDRDEDLVYSQATQFIQKYSVGDSFVTTVHSCLSV